MKCLLVLSAFLLLATASQAQPPRVPAEAGAVFGKKITADDAITPEQLFTIIRSKEKNKEVSVKLKGLVTEVCQMEGCWIKIQSPDGNMMVKMKDHAFGVPVILAGKTIVIEGMADEKITSVEQLRHFAEDAGKSKLEIAAIKEPKKEILMQAVGIVVVK